MEGIRIELVLIEITIFIVGFVGNIFVLIIVHEVKNKTIHGIFVTSLAIADLVLLCFDSPATILGRFDIKSDTFNCRVHLPGVTTGYNAGLFTITSMAIYRCYIVTHPWRSKLQRRSAIIWVSLVWVAAFVLVIPLMVVNTPMEKGCHEVWPSIGHRQAYTASLTTVQYILPLIITAICYVRIWFFLRRRPIIPRGSLSSESTIPDEEHSRESAVILRTVAVIVLLFLVLLLPTQVAWMLNDFRNVSYDELWFASEMLTRLHSCLNPVVYGVMNRQYRRSYIRFLSRMCCCGRFSNRFLLAPPQNHGTNEDVIHVVRMCHNSEGNTKNGGIVTIEGHPIANL